MTRQKVLVCGATGFIGRNIAEALALRDDLEVFGTCWKSPPLEHPRIRMRKADLTRPDHVEEALRGMDVVIQAAATTSGSKDIVNRPYIHVTDNAVMNSLIFRAAHDRKIKRVIFFSCTVMYHSSDTPLKETDFDANRELHRNYFGVGWTKVYIEKMCEFYSRIGDVRYTVIRHSNIYGPYDKFDLERSHVFGATTAKVMTAAGGRITVWGTGEEGRDLLYVSDLADFVQLAMEKQESAFELFNVGRGEAVSIRELVAKIIAVSGKRIEVDHDLSKPTIKTSLCVDTSKAKAALGWAPKVSLDEGIRNTLEWYQANILSV
ncbi:MAG: NAD-dependent epimerase/dehydratase family protein [Elusimicrobiota bacterium]